MTEHVAAEYIPDATVDSKGESKQPNSFITKFKALKTPDNGRNNAFKSQCVGGQLDPQNEEAKKTPFKHYMEE